MTSPSPWRLRLGRIPLLVLGIAALATGIWGGLVRLPIALPLPPDNANWITFHGPLMVCGFLGTVIGLERAVGLRSWWTYAAPLLTGAGAVGLMLGVPGRWPQLLVVAGSGLFLGVTVRILVLQWAPHTLLMCLAAGAWLAGNLLWLRERPIPEVVPWWIAFLGWTIVGERLELTRYLKPVAWSHPALFAALGGILAGAVLATLGTVGPGLRLFGGGLVGAAFWLFRFDIARRTVRTEGLPRFMAISLLGGYAWLAVSGGLFLWHAPRESGLPYDAALHAFFVGFVFLMIFAHAPVIFPSVLHLPPLEVRPRFYAHVALLHVSLLLRVGSDLTTWHAGRRWGAILNGITVALFLVNTVVSMVQAARRATRPVVKRV